MTKCKEDALIDFHFLNVTLRLSTNHTDSKTKALKTVQERVISLQDEFLSNRWLRWFKKTHPHFTISQSQDLEFFQFRTLCLESKKLF